MAELKETGMECVNTGTTATFWTSEQKWINKIYKLAEKNPGCVKIIEEPDDNWGVLLAHIPKSWMRIQPPKKITQTAEQKAAAAERMANARARKKSE